MDFFPAQTSLIPAQISLVRFFEQGGDIWGPYPYWYLGTTPFKYLTGPIIPIVLTFIHKLFPGINLFQIMIIFIGLIWIVGGIGVFLLTQALTNAERRRTSIFPAVFFLFGFIVPFLFRFSDGLYLITFSFLPYVLILYWKFLRHKSNKIVILLIVSISFVILLDSLIIPTLVIGMICLLLAQRDWNRIEVKIKSSCLLLFAGLLVATVWYTPGYWLTLLGAPSLAGEGLFRVIASLGKILPIALALAAAIFSIRLSKKRETLRDFTFYWFFIFGFLSFLRFLSDPDFWLDWSAYGIELQLGLGMTFGILTQKLWLTGNKILFGVLFAVYLVFGGIIFNKYVLGTFQRDIKQSLEYQISSQLNKIAKPGDRVFLSGSTAFWLNTFVDLSQVRGGVDQASKDGSWRNSAWEITKGEDSQKALEAIKKLGVKYLVVHTNGSQEYYHDFKNTDKYLNSDAFKLLYNRDGDFIYYLK